tara:strand:- start:2071 stop:2520 length:450 start_codon:yes stop_codon:yes gene_type:complete
MTSKNNTTNVDFSPVSNESVRKNGLKCFKEFSDRFPNFEIKLYMWGGTIFSNQDCFLEGVGIKNGKVSQYFLYDNEFFEQKDTMAEYWLSHRIGENINYHLNSLPCVIVGSKPYRYVKITEPLKDLYEIPSGLTYKIPKNDFVELKKKD